MSRKLDYKEQIKSPKWQKRRLEIMQRDSFTCQICGETEKQLHVHHTIYIPGREIWDYFDSNLITLCEDCHKKEHGNGFDDHSFDGSLYELRLKGYTNLEIQTLLDSIICEDNLLVQLADEYRRDEPDNELSKKLFRLANRRKQIDRFVELLNDEYFKSKQDNHEDNNTN